ncbi:MAG: class I adenylate-forming enzyme family protein [Thermoleophilia bacterium]
MKHFESMTVAGWLRRWALVDPTKPALVFEGRRTTYADLDRRVDAVCRWLQSLGIEKGDRVAVLLRNCPAFLELYLACSRLGSVFVPLNFRIAPSELCYLVGDSRPRLLVYDARFEDIVVPLGTLNDLPPLLLAHVGGGSGALGVDYEEAVAAKAGGGHFIPLSPGPDNAEEPQVIMYTSGTTGRPKGAVLSHRKAFFNSLNAEIFFELSSHDVMLIVTPLFHSGALFIQASPSLYKGCTIILHESFVPGAVLRDIEGYQVTKFQAVPTVYRRLLEEYHGEANLTSLAVCAIGGEPVRAELIAGCRQAGIPLRQIMGQTETSILLWCTDEEMLERPGTIGRPVFHAEVELVDETGRFVSPGEVGEIAVRGSVCMSEYWGDPVQTERIMVGGWLRTGDLARRDREGYYYLIDRARDMYISGGENVYPAEVERVLELHPGIREAAVVGCVDDRWGEVGHAFVVLEPGADLTLADVHEFLEGRLAKYKWPAHLAVRESLPRTATGKVQKHELREWLALRRCRSASR